MITGPGGFHQIATAVMEAVRDDLAATPSGPLERACVVPGAIAWDECECGMLAVAAARWFLSNAFPEESAGATMPGCGAAWRVAELVIQVARCAPGPDARGAAPTCTALAASALEVTTDASVTLSTVACLLHEMRRDRQIVDYTITGQLASGPSGNCTGSELRVLVAIPNTA